MEKYEHLKLPVFKENIERQKPSPFGGFPLPLGRNKATFAQHATQQADELASSFSALKNKFSGKLIDPSLIYEIEINQSVSTDGFRKDLSKMGIHVLSVAEGKKGFWVVFSDDEYLNDFKRKVVKYSNPIGEKISQDAFKEDAKGISLVDSKHIREIFKQKGLLDSTYSIVKEKAKIFGSIDKVKIEIPEKYIEHKKHIVSVLKKAHPGNYDFFNAIESFQDIPPEKKIGKSLKDKPLGDTGDFIDIELWRMEDQQKNKNFIQQLKDTYNDLSQFKITDTLSTKSFVLLRVKLTKEIFNEIIELKEISRADRPSLPQFNPFEDFRPDISEIEFYEPLENASGILVIDSGIVSNHPMLEKCVGGEENFQSGETELQDTVGHGTAVAGCVAYGDIDNCLETKNFTPENWIFSAKVMYAERNDITGTVSAIYDPEKLIEHQFKGAVESFLSNPDYHIKVVNISLGNHNEIWHNDYFRQLPLAALIDELAFTFPNVTFIVSAGNQDPQNIYNSIQEIIDNYPSYLTENEDFKLINPATSALALTVGSIAGIVRTARERFGAEDIKTAIAKEHQPSPFTRTGSGINGMIKPELVEYGGNLILSETNGRIIEDTGGKIALLNNKTTEDIIKYDYGTSFSAPKLAYLAGKIANKYPQRSANFIKNMLLVGSDYPFVPDDHFYGSIPLRIGIKKFDEKIIDKIASDYEKIIVSNAFQREDVFYNLIPDISTDVKRKISTIFKSINYKSELGFNDNLLVCGFGLSNYEKAINSYNNRTVLWDEGQIALNQIKVYSLQLPEIFFTEKGKKKIIVTLTFNPETRSTRGDSYLGNRMEFHLFHSANPQVLIKKYGVISENTERTGVPPDLKKFEIDFYPGGNTRKAGCHQKAWKEYKREPENVPSSPISLVLLNFNKWIKDDNRLQDYCISVTFEHEKEIELYNEIRANVQARTRVR